MSYATDKFDDEVVRLIKSGAVGFMPSDTIYGLSGLALNKGAIERIHKIKGRDKGKPLIVLISNIKMLDVLSIDQEQAQLISSYWPGPLSVVFKSNLIPDWLQLGTQSLAVRLPKHKGLLDLIERVGPIVSTSANLQNQPPVQTVKQAQQIFGEKLDFYVDAGSIMSLPSTVAVIKDGELQVIRPGAVKIN